MGKHKVASDGKSKARSHGSPSLLKAVECPLDFILGHATPGIMHLHEYHRLILCYNTGLNGPTGRGVP